MATRIRVAFLLFALACISSRALAQLELNIKQHQGIETAQTNSAAAPQSKPNPKHTALEALHVKEILQFDGKAYISWFDPYPEKRTYFLQIERVTTLAAIARAQLRYLEAKSSSKFSSDEMISKRRALETELANAEKSNKVISEWRPMRDVVIRDIEKNLKQASFPLPIESRSITVRITSVAPDGTRSPFRSVVRIPIEVQTSFWKRHRWLLVSLTLLVVFSGVLVWSLRRRGVWPRKASG